MTTHVVVDAANVIGSRPDGWWRDRAGAARRFAGELVAVLVERPEALADALGTGGDGDGDGLVVHLVLEGAAGRVEDLPTHPRLRVHRAPADGDTAIAQLAGELDGDVLVVTADRGLRARVGATGARVAGPSTVLDLLPGARRAPGGS